MNKTQGVGHKVSKTHMKKKLATSLAFSAVSVVRNEIEIVNMISRSWEFKNINKWKIASNTIIFQYIRK